jgi:hypothetical protein
MILTSASSRAKCTGEAVAEEEAVDAQHHRDGPPSLDTFGRLAGDGAPSASGVRRTERSRARPLGRSWSASRCRWSSASARTSRCSRSSWATGFVGAIPSGVPMLLDADGPGTRSRTPWCAGGRTATASWMAGGPLAGHPNSLGTSSHSRGTHRLLTEGKVPAGRARALIGGCPGKGLLGPAPAREARSRRFRPHPGHPRGGDAEGGSQQHARPLGVAGAVLDEEHAGPCSWRVHRCSGQRGGRRTMLSQ